MRPRTGAASGLLLSSARTKLHHANLRSPIVISYALPIHSRMLPRHLPRGTSRPFSISQASDYFINLGQSILSDVHVLTGTPWYITIPLFSIAVSLAFRLPTSILSFKAHDRHVRLMPLVAALEAKRVAALRHNPDHTPEQRAREVEKVRKRTRRGVYREWGAQEWKKWLTLAGLPAFLVAIEAVRRMCGTTRGLLGTLAFGPDRPGMEEVLEGASATSETSQSIVTVADGTVEASGAVSPGTGIDTSFEVPSHMSMDLSLTTGGCLWFPDLTEPDPLHVLPFILTALIVASMMPNSAAGVRLLLGDTSHMKQDRWRIRLQRGLLILGTMVPLTVNLPAAVHVYWISNTTFATVSALLIRRWLRTPRQKTIPAPCRGHEIYFVLPKPVAGARVDKNTEVQRGRRPRAAKVALHKEKPSGN